VARADGGGSRAGGSPGGGGAHRAPDNNYEGKHRAPDCTHSFDPSTLVLLANGATKPIGDVDIGDQVAATDPATGRTGPRSVQAAAPQPGPPTSPTSRSPPKDGSTVLHTTQHHPFWDRTLGDWVDAANLAAGHELRTLDGDVVTVVEVRNFTGSTEMRGPDGGGPAHVLRAGRRRAGPRPQLQSGNSGPRFDDRSGETNFWDMSSNDRGIAFEREMGMSNLPDGFKTFDHLESDSGIAISVKTVDTRKSSTKTNTGLLQPVEGIYRRYGQPTTRVTVNPGVDRRPGIDHRVLLRRSAL
jgi:hypothetical protein